MKLRTQLVLSISVLLSLLLVALPLLIGLILGRALPQAIAALDRQMGGVSLRLLDFERHWFGSELNIAIQPEGSLQALVHRSTLSHGPWPLVPLAWLSGQGKLVNPATGLLVEDQWRVSIAANLSAEIQAQWDPPTTAEHLDLDLQLQAARSLKQVSVSLLPSSAALPGLIETRQLSGSAHFVSDDQGDWQLHLLLLAESFGAGLWPQALVAPQLSLKLQTRASNASASVQVRADGVDAAPDHHYRDAALGLKLEHLHRQSLSQWLAAVQAAHRSGLRGPFLIESARGAGLLALPGLLANQPLIRLETLALSSPQGKALARFELGLPVAPPAGFLANPLSLLEVLALNGQLELPEPLAQRWAQLRARAELGPEADAAEVSANGDEFLLRLRANQLLKREAGLYRMQLELVQGELTLNGQSMLLPIY